MDYLHNYQKNIIFAAQMSNLNKATAMTDKEFAKEQYEQLKRYAEYVWHNLPDGPERDNIIEEILIGMSEAKRRYNELNDEL